MAQNPALLNQLYDMELGGINLGKPTLPGEQLRRWEQAGTEALSNYRDITAPTLTPVTRPTTIRQASLPQPRMSSGFSMKAGSTGLPGTPETTLPTYDTGKVEALAQRLAAPGVRRLRNEVQNVQQGYYENPNVKRMTLRDALEGYGTGLENVMGGALSSASGIYGQEYGPKVQSYLQGRSLATQEAMQGRQIASNERIAELNNQWRAWLANQG